MSGTAPRSSLGACETRACQREFGHKGECVLRRCAHRGCSNRTRNAEELFCVRHESRATYEQYVATDGSSR